MQLIPYAEPGLIGLWDIYPSGLRLQIAEFQLHPDGWGVRVKMHDHEGAAWYEWIDARYPTPEEAANEVAEWMIEAEPIRISVANKVVDLEEYRRKKRG